jgi:hypothetical protein
MKSPGWGDKAIYHNPDPYLFYYMIHTSYNIKHTLKQYNIAEIPQNKLDLLDLQSNIPAALM